MTSLPSLAARWRDRVLDEHKPADSVGSLLRGPAVTISERTPIAAARRLLLEHRVAAIAVVDDRAQLRGLITRTDVLRAEAMTTPVGDLMSMFVFALPWTASIRRAAALIAYEEVGQVVVLGVGGSVLGIVSAVDITRYFALGDAPAP